MNLRFDVIFTPVHIFFTNNGFNNSNEVYHDLNLLPNKKRSGVIVSNDDGIDNSTRVIFLRVWIYWHECGSRIMVF